jgi:hypothetical protein
MRNRTFWVTAIGLAALLVAGGLFASNMGLKLNYPLDAAGTNGSLDGTNMLALPFNQQTNLVDAEDLLLDINASPSGVVVAQVCAWLKASNGLDCYTGTAGNNFTLAPAEGYFVQVSTGGNYIVVGSHDPVKVVAFDAAGTNGSLDGTNVYAWNYHSTLTDAQGLINEIEAQGGVGSVAQVCAWLKASNGLDCYTGTAGNNFSLVPGEAYFVQVSSNISYTPSHY